jgi:glycosyltransferase involved in cell wall biosynthesis
VSIVICTLNCKKDVKRCLESIKKQDYPKKKLEILIVDSYSTDGTIEVAKEYGAKVILTKIRGYMEGKGMPKSMGCQKAKGEFILTIDSDNALVEKDWIKKSVFPMMQDKEINFTISTMYFSNKDNLLNRYLSLGVGTDPFTDYGSIDPQFAMGKMKMQDNGKYFTYTLTPKNHYVFGGYYTTYRKSTLESIGGYMRDVDNGWVLSKKEIGKFAIPKNSHIHHLMTPGFLDFFKKKIKWAKFYFEHQSDSREFSWQMGWFGRFGKIRFYTEVFKSLILFPAFFESIKLIIKQKRKEWLFHSPMKFLTTFAYILARIKTI